jgi:hypothetical protein
MKPANDTAQDVPAAPPPAPSAPPPPPALVAALARILARDITRNPIPHRRAA